MSFLLIIKLGFIVFALFSLISYAINRSNNKANLKNAISTSEAIRELNQDEYNLLHPYMEDKHKVTPYKLQTELVNNDVYYLEGACTRHSLSSNGGESSYYYAINDVEVFFPYSMENYTVDYNQAEVVFTQKYAFVININGVTLADAAENLHEAEQREMQWHAGESGQFKSINQDAIVDLDEQQSEDVKALIKKAALSRCEIVKQRDESEIEHSLHNKNNTGFLSSLCLIIAAGCGIAYSSYSANDLPLFLLVICVITLALAIWLYFKQVTPPIERVNQVKGSLTFKDAEHRTLCIGDTLTVEYPEYWHEYIDENASTEVDVDVRVNERQMIRFGHSLSIEQEVKSFGLVSYWGRNCYLWIVGTVLTLIAFYCMPPLALSYSYTYSLLTGKTTPVTITSEQQLRSQTLSYGNWVDIQTTGHCDPYDIILCDRLQLNSGKVILDSVDKTLLELPEWITKLKQDKLLNKIRDSEVIVYEHLTKERDSSTYDPYGYNRYGTNNRANYIKVTNIDRITFIVNDVCLQEQLASSYPCKTLQRDLFSLLSGKDGKWDNWSNMINDMQAKKLDRTMLTDMSTVTQLNKELSDLADKYLEVKMQEQRNLIDVAQLGNDNIFIDIQAYPNSRYVEYPSHRQILSNNLVKRADFFNYNTLLMTGQAESSFRVQGMVTGVKQDSEGHNNYININANMFEQKMAGFIAPFVINTVLFTLLALFSVSQLLIMLVKITKNKKRFGNIRLQYHRTHI